MPHRVPPPAAVAAAIVASAALAASRPAHADPACTDATALPNPLFLSIGDTQVNLIKAIGQRLRDTEDVTLVFRATGSCTNLDTLYARSKLTGTLSYIPAHYDAQAMPTPPTCTVAPPGVPLDLANSIVFLDGCASTKPPLVVDLLGPVQSFVFVVPTAQAGESAITAEEAYFVFGFGRAGGVTPWVDEKQLYVRPVTKGTIISAGASIGVPPGRWKGVRIDQSKDLASAVATSPSPQSAIGILGSEVYDQYRASLKALAFRAFGQYHAYFPDSTATSFDRRNVRDGHYHLWSYTHWLYWTSDGSTPERPLARRVAALIAGEPVTPAPAFEPLAAVQRVGLVPRCAMAVRRTTEGGDFTAFEPPAPCGCYFESLVGTSSCAACVDDAACSGGACRHGFCEAR